MQTLQRLTAAVLAFLQRFGWLLCLGVVALFTLAVVRPFQSTPDPPEDLAVKWNQAIAKFGISPVFPPEEDFHVGDIWAVISEAPNSPLLGRAVRLGHIDLREDMAGDNAARPIFAETAQLKEADEFRHQDEMELEPTEVPGKRIRLTLAAFPGISISHITRAASSAGTSLFGFGASRDESMVEELRIPVAETYGVRSAAAGGRLMIWCASPEYGSLCTDSYARRLLAYTTDARVLDKVTGTYPVRIELQIVTRTFMTRTIEQHRMQLSSHGAAVMRGPSSARPATPSAVDGEKTTTPEAKARDAVSAAEAGNGAAATSDGTGMSSNSGDLADIRLQQTFLRPVVFGYRSWNVQLKPEETKP